MSEHEIRSVLRLSSMWKFFSEAERVEAVNYCYESLEQSKKRKGE